MATWKRIKRQEGGNVYRWYEKGQSVASIVKGYFPGEANIRITGYGFGGIEIRGHKSAILGWSESFMFKKFDNYIKAEKNHKPLRRRRK